MAIYANPSYFEREHEGHFEHVLVAVRYNGPSRWYNNSSASSQGKWPTNQNFLQGIWHVAFVPESTPSGVSGEGVAWFDRNEHFDVAFDQATIARAIIEDNAGELTVGGPIGEGESVVGFEEKLHEALGIEDPIQAGMPVIDQLYEIAGIDRTEGLDDRGPEVLFVEEYDREELKDLVKDTREDASEFSLRGVSMTDMAEYLVSKGVEP